MGWCPRRSMLITFSCDFCGKVFQKDSSFAGRKARCKDCGQVFIIPGLLSKAGSGMATDPGRAGGGSFSPSQPELSRPARARPALPPQGDRPTVPNPRPRPSASSVDGVDDPFGLNDVPASSKPVSTPTPAPYQAVEEEVLPRRVAPISSKSGKRRSGSSRNEGIGAFAGLPGIVYLVDVGILGLGLAISAISAQIGGYILLGGGVLSFLVPFLYGLAGVLIVPFRERFFAGLGCWLCPPFLLGYVITRWDAMKGPFLSYIASFGVAIVVAIALPGVAGRNRAALPSGFT